MLRESLEKSICVGDSGHELISLIDKTCSKRLAKNYKYTHLGLIIVGVKGMTRKHLGAHTMITIIDEKIPDKSKRIISMVDVDMSNNRGLFYCAPDYFLRSEDLYNIKLGILTKGYGDITKDNLVITIGFVGKSAQSTNIKFKCPIDDLIEAISSKGVRFLKPKKYSAEEYIS